MASLQAPRYTIPVNRGLYPLGGGLLAALGLPFLLLASHDPYQSTGRSADPTSKSIAEIRASERRRIPIDVALKAAHEASVPGPVEVTVMVTNLFDAPLLMNARMLVNHPKLQGELSFAVIGPDGKRCEIQRLVTPMSVHDDDFVVLPRGQSIQRTVDLADIYKLERKGTYKVTAVYRNDLDEPRGQQRAWKGVVQSEPVEIEVN